MWPQALACTADMVSNKQLCQDKVQAVGQAGAKVDTKILITEAVVYSLASVFTDAVAGELTYLSALGVIDLTAARVPIAGAVGAAILSVPLLRSMVRLVRHLAFPVHVGWILNNITLVRDPGCTQQRW